MSGLKTYHMPDGDEHEEIVFQAVAPIPDPRIRMIACSAKDAEILRNAAELYSFVGKAEEAMALQGLAMAYTLT